MKPMLILTVLAGALWGCGPKEDSAPAAPATAPSAGASSVPPAPANTPPEPGGMIQPGMPGSETPAGG